MDKTIAAISTGLVKSGIGIVRMSGIDSIEIAKTVFKSVSNKDITSKENKKLLYGYIYDGEDMVDEVLISFMYGPHTYTTEDMVEIYCHGSVVSLRKILEVLLSRGASLADKGEFTKRAFLNGRLDLSQAEAVAELIDATSKASYEASLNQLRGSLSREINSVRGSVQGLLASMEVLINFSEDEDYLDDSGLKEQILGIESRLDELIESSKKGKLIKEGINTIILGKPNVGKSSLLNALLRQNRAIVTDIPGTTRDVIEESMVIDSIPINIMDTAGIRDTSDLVEKMGVERSIDLAKSADLIIGVFDSSRDFDEEDEKIIDLMKDKKALAILNKIDLGLKINEEDLASRLGEGLVIATSIKENKGVEDLEEAISDLFYLGEIDAKTSPVLTNTRHIDLIKKARANLIEAKDALAAGLPIDMAEVDIRSCWLNLGKITGQNMDTEDLLDQIFGEFCIGK